MTIYYVDHSAGSDSNDGLAWASAWFSLRGLRASAITLAAGDEVRFASTPLLTGNTYTHGMYDTISVQGMSQGNTTRSYTCSPTPSRRQASLYMTSRQSGVMVAAPNLNLPLRCVHVRSPSGQFNASGAVLLTSYIEQGDGPVHGVFVYIRVTEAYTGVNAGPIPAGTIEVRIMSSNTTTAGAVVVDRPIAMDGSYTRVYVPLSSQVTAWRFDVVRTSQPTNWDASPLSLAFMVPCGLSSRTPANGGGLVLRAIRAAAGTTQRNEEVCGDNDMTILSECVDGLSINGMPTFIKAGGTTRIPTTITERIEPPVVADLDRRGEIANYPADAQGAYDLNASAGGTPLAPVTLSGGWNTQTDTQDGYTVYSAAWHHGAPAPVSLFDLHGADHVVIRRLGACTGFASLFTRARTVTLEHCYLGISLGSAFGIVTQDTHVTLTDMYLGPGTLANIGVMGDFTMVRCHYPCETTTPEYTNTLQVRKFTAEDSFYGLQTQGRATGASLWPTVCRGDATLINCTQGAYWYLLTDRFGNKLRMVGHKAFNASSTPMHDIETGPASPWDEVTYEFSGVTGGGTYNRRNVGPTMVARFSHGALDRTIGDTSHVTADKVHVKTGMRLNPLNVFVQQQWSTAPEKAGYLHGVNLALTTATNAHEFHRSATAPVYLHPRQFVTVEDGGVKTHAISEDLPCRPAGYFSMAGPIRGINYRVVSDVYLTALRHISLACLKTFVIAKPGRYRVHVGINAGHWQPSFPDGSGRLANTIAATNGIASPPNGTDPSPVVTLTLYSTVISGAPPSATITELPNNAYFALPFDVRTGLRSVWDDVYLEFEAEAPGSVDLTVSTPRPNVPCFVIDAIDIEKLP